MNPFDPNINTNDNSAFESWVESLFNDWIDFLKEQLSIGRPNRNEVINNDDITNLKITLETCKSFEDFLKII